MFSASGSWWWVIVAPCASAVLSGWTYDVLIGQRFPTHQA